MVGFNLKADFPNEIKAIISIYTKIPRINGL